ncbi:MAG: RiPP maturation radical SAM C-methyltransferase [Thermoanaerobaculia bacterium]|nr:RiPP maturation radical SAM C-methyltransferase [Thermoanaerobaculia bacterium]
MRVALVVMPFAAADSPSLAAGLLKAELGERGITCDVKHFNVTLALMAGSRDYERISKQFQSASLAGEWIFSQQYYGNGISDWERYDREVLSHPLWGAGDGDREVILRILSLAPAFLKVAYASTDWSRYDLVGFTSTFEQTMPAMWLAREIRSNHPEVRIAAGGANFESVMGRALMETFDQIDFVCDGEGDVSFPALCEAVRDGGPIPPGILHRRDGAIVGTPRVAGFTDLDSLPDPDFDDYFRVIESSTPRLPVSWIPVEASRGCWWGQKAHCTFCGLNGDAMTFRKKGWRRMAGECERLVQRYRPDSLQFTDNILANEFLRDLLPYWKSTGDPTPKFFEVKSNLTRPQISLMREAGVLCVQAGIESLSDATLSIMRKGVTAAQNVATLRWCRELGITMNWNILFGFPGAPVEEFPRQLELMRALQHLDAPSFCGVIRLDRFSPNFTSWRELGFSEPRPMPAYAHIFEMPPARVRDAAYYFEYEHPTLQAALEAGQPLVDFGAAWRARSGRGEQTELELHRHFAGGTVLVDTREGMSHGHFRLSPVENACLLAFDAPRTRESGLGVVARDFDVDAAATAVERLVRRKAIVAAGARLVTVALMRDPVRDILSSLNPTAPAVESANTSEITQCPTS